MGRLLQGVGSATWLLVDDRPCMPWGKILESDGGIKLQMGIWGNWEVTQRQNWTLLRLFTRSTWKLKFVNKNYSKNWCVCLFVLFVVGWTPRILYRDDTDDVDLFRVHNCLCTNNLHGKFWQLQWQSLQMWKCCEVWLNQASFWKQFMRRM